VAVPAIDLAPFRDGSERARRLVAAALDEACRQVGFFTIIGHGVDPAVVDRARREALAFFDLPLADRLTAAAPAPDAPYGYAPFAGETLARSLGDAPPPDLKETFNVGPIDPPPRPVGEMDDADERDIYSPNVWPSVVAPGLRPALEAYYRAMAALATLLLEVMATALHLDRDWFVPFTDQHTSALRLAHYPPLERRPPPGQLRASPHTDYGTLTILLADAGEPGLQVLDRSDRWVQVDPPDGSFVVNIGDLFARWTNDRWRSTLHRVVVPDTSAGGAARRLSLPFFHNANWDALVECIPTCLAGGEVARYGPVRAGPHLMSKFRATVT
jgi:isopenicillin N synthase-like dioxygenase